MKVLCYTSPARGHLFPTVPILLELQRRGPDVVVRTIGAAVPTLRELGLKADPVDPAIEAVVMDDYGARGSQASIKRAVRVFADRARIEVPEVQALIAEERPDLLLVDTNSWGAGAVAEASGLPWASVLPFPTPLPSDDVPPFGPGLRPGGGQLGRLRNRLLRPLVVGVLERTLLPPLNEGARRWAGVGDISDAHDLYTRPPLTLYLTSTAFEYPRTDWPATFCFVGPLAWDPPAATPAWSASDRPVALVTTSSEFQDDGALVEAALAGLAGEDLDVVATMPAGVSAGLTVPDNARVEEYVPHSLVLPGAAVAITHGGMGATQKVLAAGVPVVVVPWGRDQSEVGRRAEATGAGVLLPRRRLTPDNLRDAVRRARTLKPAAEALAARMAAEGGAPLAVDRLEALSAAG